MTGMVKPPGEDFAEHEASDRAAGSAAVIAGRRSAQAIEREAARGLLRLFVFRNIFWYA